MSRAWQPIETSADFERLVRLGETGESLTLEFKEDVGGYRAPKGSKARVDGHREVARDISQFANTVGGCMLVGVAEATQEGRRVAAHVHALDDVDGRVKWIEQAITTYLVPSTLSHAIVPISLEHGTILAINVPPSVHLVSVWDRKAESIQAYRRTNHGKQALNPDEYEAHLMDGSRAKKIAFDRVYAELQATSQVVVHLGRPLIVIERLSNGSEERFLDTRVVVWEIREHEFGLRLQGDVDGIVRVPYELIRAVWRHSGTELGLLLEPKLVWHRDRIVFG